MKISSVWLPLAPGLFRFSKQMEHGFSLLLLVWITLLDELLLARLPSGGVSEVD